MSPRGRGEEEQQSQGLSSTGHWQRRGNHRTVVLKTTQVGARGPKTEHRMSPITNGQSGLVASILRKSDTTFRVDSNLSGIPWDFAALLNTVCVGGCPCLVIFRGWKSHCPRPSVSGDKQLEYVPQRSTEHTSRSGRNKIQ